MTNKELIADASGHVPAHPHGAQHEELRDHGLWVFGYGSLMWNPEFEFVERAHGRAAGVHRCFCVRSIHHRGTPRRPGLVLGLDGGGSCDGVLFRVPPKLANDVVQYLRRREQVTRVYKEMYRVVEVSRGPREGQRLRALCYVAERGHTQYVNRLSLEAQAKIIRECIGLSGRNIDYLLSTMQHLKDLGIDDPQLRRVLAMTGCCHRLK